MPSPAAEALAFPPAHPSNTAKNPARPNRANAGRPVTSRAATRSSMCGRPLRSAWDPWDHGDAAHCTAGAGCCCCSCCGPAAAAAAAEESQLSWSAAPSLEAREPERRPLARDASERSDARRDAAAEEGQLQAAAAGVDGDKAAARRASSSPPMLLQVPRELQALRQGVESRVAWLSSECWLERGAAARAPLPTLVNGRGSGGRCGVCRVSRGGAALLLLLASTRHGSGCCCGGGSCCVDRSRCRC